MVSVILGLLPTRLNQMWGGNTLDRATTYLDKLLERGSINTGCLCLEMLI